MVKILASLAGGYLGLVALMFVFQRGLMYHPDRDLPSPSEAGLSEASLVSLATGDGLSLKAWYKASPPGGKTLVLVHGNGAGLAHRAHKAKAFMDLGFGFLLVGYRGFNGNPGSPSEDGLYADIRAAMAFLAAEGAGPDRVVLYGESLGAAVAVQAALEAAGAGTPVAGLILEAPFTSMADAAQHHYPFLPARWLVRDRYASIDKIAGVETRLLVFHGTADGVVPWAFGRRLYEAARPPKAFLSLDDIGHDAFNEDAWKGIRLFLSGAEGEIR
jgi:fermentation-respiration switch protein FrsA (DUF1100 family)